MFPVPNLTVTHFNLSIFRIVFFAAFFGDLFSLYLWRRISFSTNWIPDIILPIALVSLGCLTVGFKTRQAAILSFLLLNVVLFNCDDVYVFDSICLAFVFAFIFAPTPFALAVDVVASKRPQQPQAAIPVWFVLFLFSLVEIIYLDSVLFKITSTIWMQGTAFWLSAALPHFARGPFPGFLNNVLLLQLLTWGAGIIEICYPLILVKQLRQFMAGLGILLHGMMTVFFPITFFGLGMVATYLLYVDFPPSLLARFRLKAAAQAGNGIEAQSASNAKSAIEAQSAPNAKSAIEASSAFAPEPTTHVAPAPCTVPQIAAIALLWLMQLVLLFGEKTSPVGQATSWVCKSLGICRHPVYINGHFSVQEPILRFQVKSGNQTYWLPSFNEKGYPELSNRYFCMTTVKLRASANSHNKEDVVVRYIKGNLERLDVRDADVMVYGKDVYVPLAIDFTAPERIENRTWKPVARATFKDGRVNLVWITP